MYRRLGTHLFFAALVGCACSDRVAGPNQRPVAVAPPDQSAEVDRPLFLDGGASYDPDGDGLRYRWRVLGGTVDVPVSLGGAQTRLARLTPHAPGAWVIQLVVSDGRLDSEPALIQVRVPDPSCREDSECDDGNPCTTDTCLTGGCRNQAGNDGAACDDRDACTMNDRCLSGSCTGEPLDADGDSYPSGACQGNDCDDSDPEINPGAGEGPAGSESCLDQTDNDCDGLTDSADTGCESCSQDADCDDGLVCTRDECHDSGGCLNPPLADGTACDQGAGQDGNPCNSSCRDGVCIPEPASPDQPCDDGFACSQPDVCDGEGNCQGTLLSAMCGFGQACLPECARDPSGCVDVPASLELHCEDPVWLSHAENQSSCQLQAGDGQYAGLAACLACQARVAATVLDRSAFDDGNQSCRLDGWQLVPGTGQHCTDNLTGCNFGSPRECCDDPGTLCDDSFAPPVLRSDKAQNCGGGIEEWRLFKFFNTSDLSELRVCFDLAEQDATNNDTVMVAVADPADVANAEVIFCLDDGPAVSVNRFFYRACADLPAWTWDRSEIVLAFALHSNDNGDILYLDNVEVTGWGPGCTGHPQVVLQDGFDGCDWSDWVVSGGIDCPATFSCDGSDSLMVANEIWTLEKTGIDASSLDSGIELCFDHGDKAADSAGESLSVLLETGNGWRVVWERSAEFGPDNTCRQVCLDLSHLAPEVHNHPSLGIRFRLTSDRNGDLVVLDNVILRGNRHCPADAQLVQLSDPIDQDDGSYAFQVLDGPSEQLTTGIRCFWKADPAIAADSTIRFRY